MLHWGSRLEDEVGDAAAAGRRPPPSDAGTSRGSCFQSRADQKIQACIHHCGHNLTEIIDILLSVVCSFLSIVYMIDIEVCIALHSTSPK